MALGAVAALESANRPDINVVGFDGSNDARYAILSGKLHATVLQPVFRQAQYPIELANKWLKTGETGLPEKLLMDCILIDKTNAKQLENFALTY